MCGMQHAQRLTTKLTRRFPPPFLYVTHRPAFAPSSLMRPNQPPPPPLLQLFSILAVGYCLEPLLTKLYMSNVIAAGEKILATLRLELYRTLLMQRISFFDSHSASELSGLISVELDAVRSFIFKWV